MRLLVCGGRSYGIFPDRCPADQHQYWRERMRREVFFLRETLDCLHVKERITVLIHGGAPGADSLAGAWAAGRGIKIESFKVSWRLGRRGWPIRNRRMLVEGRPEKVVSFPGGDETADMVAKARAAGVPVFEAGI